jgi:hypothetical protein
MNQQELGNVVASGRATPEQWDEYWSVYAKGVESQRRQKEQEAQVAEQRSQQEQFEDAHPPEKPVQHRQGDRSSAVGVAGISLGSALAIVLSFELSHSILWAIVHGILSWLYVIYRASQGNY